MLSAAVLAGAWLTASRMDGLAGPARGEPPEATPAPIPLAVGSREELTALSWSWEGQTVNLRRTDDGHWENADDPDFPVDEGAAEALARAAASTEASMAVEGVTDMAQYGLDDAPLKVIAAAGEACASYEVGNMSITGEYYTRLNGEDRVYLETGALAAFRTEPTALLALDQLPGDIASVTGLAVRSDAGDYAVSLRGEDWVRTDGGEERPLEEEGVAELLEAVLGTDLTRCAGWTAEDAERCGLDAPQMTAVLYYRSSAGAERSFTLDYGDYAEGGIFVSLAGSELVCLTDAAGADALMYPDWDSLIPAPVLNLDLDAVASLEVELGGESFEVLRLEEQTERPVGEDDSVTVTDVIWSRGGFVLDTKRVESWLRSAAGLTALPSPPAGGGRETLLRLTVIWRDEESIPAELELRSYDSARCLCAVGEDRLLLVDRDAAEAVVSQAAEAFERE